MELKDRQQQKTRASGKLALLDGDDAGSGSLVDSVLSTVLNKRSSDAWVVRWQLHCCFFYACFWASCLEIKTQYSTQRCTVKNTKAQSLVEDAYTCDNVRRTCQLTSMMGHVNTCSAL